MNNAEYEQAELIRHSRYMQSIDRAPLAERKEAQADYAALLRQPEHVQTLTGYLLNGDYGYHPHVLARTIADRPRMNRAAAMSQILAAYETRTPARHAIAAWKSLTSEEQTAANAAIMAAIQKYEQGKES